MFPSTKCRDVTLPTENLTHPSFRQPADATILAWRYLDFPKLVSLITSRKLFFTRLDNLPDKFEGTFPPKNVQATVRLMLEGLTPAPPAKAAMNVARQVSAAQMTLRKKLYVNCWRLGDFESEAMWRIYCPHGPGVAVILQYQKLRDSLVDQSQYIGLVKYIDSQSETVGLGNAFNAAMHKRREFSHENEARIVYPLTFDGDRDEPSPDFVTFTWPVEECVEQILVSPYAEPWHVRLIYETVERLLPALAPSLKLSPMAQSPWGWLHE